MRPFAAVLLLAMVAAPVFGDSLADLKAQTFRHAIEMANDALELHNSVAVAAESIMVRAEGRRKREMELLGVVLGAYSIYYKKYCTILQELDRLERVSAPTPSDEANRAEFWRRLASHRDSLWKSSGNVAQLATQMGIAVPSKWVPKVTPTR